MREREREREREVDYIIIIILGGGFVAYNYQGFPKLTESCNHFSKILPTTADIKGRLYRK